MEIYSDYSMMFAQSALQFGRDNGSWGQIVVQPHGDGINSCSQFFDNALRPTSGELMLLKDGWVFNVGFRNPDGSINRISTIQEILSDPSGSHDITVPGGPQHYAIQDIPDYAYSVWTLANIINPQGQVTGTYSHSQYRYPPADFTNQYWLGDANKTRRCIGHHEEWWDGNGGWSMKLKRTAHLAKNMGLWHVHDDLATDPIMIEYGMRFNWTY